MVKSALLLLLRWMAAGRRASIASARLLWAASSLLLGFFVAVAQDPDEVSKIIQSHDLLTMKSKAVTRAFSFWP